MLSIGNTDDLASLEAALTGAYGAWINIDTFTVGEMKEMWSAMRIFELAKKVGVKHFIWSSLEYITKVRSSLPRTWLLSGLGTEFGLWRPRSRIMTRSTESSTTMLKDESLTG